MSNLSELDKMSLLALCKEQGIKGYSKLTKPQLIEVLNSNTGRQEVKQDVPGKTEQPVKQVNSECNEFSNLTSKQLRELLRNKGVDGALSTCNKTDLIKMLSGEVELPKRKVTENTTWNQALQEFNKTRSSYLMPKRDTEEYKEVMKIKERLDNEKTKKKSSKV